MRSIPYWNQESFEGLASMASVLRSDSRLAHLAAYCELRGQGLRRRAFAELEAFLERARSFEPGDERFLAQQVLDAAWGTNEPAHQLLSHPLRTRFLEPVLERWCAADSENPVPARYLALLRQERALLDAALRLNPTDDVLRATLATRLIGDVEFAVHHLADGTFVGDEAEAAAELANAASILEGAADASRLVALVQRIASLSALLADWQEYRRAPEGTFPAWCRARNRDHSWGSSVFYAGGRT